MPNGSEMLNELNLEKHIKELPDRQLLEFTARQVYEASQGLHKVVGVVEIHETRITATETICKERGDTCVSAKTSKKTVGISAGIGGILVAAIDFLLKRFVG